jgi:hypothetical protein
LLSPVTTITRIPAVIHESIAFLTSFLGGSSIPTFYWSKGADAKKMWEVEESTSYLEGAGILSHKYKQAEEEGAQVHTDTCI